MKKFFSFAAIILLVGLPAFSQKDFPDIVLQTSEGNITLRLYDNTPLHSKNFVKLVNAGYYDNQLFHRVIKNFMIQSGDPDSKNAKPSAHLGIGGPNYTIPPEFNPMYYHKKGALAAARQSDNVNPKKESSGSQFYIVVGQVFSKNQLDGMAKNGRHSVFSQEERDSYTTIGGTPNLDLQNTVFGEVIEGLDIIDKISQVQTDSNDRPLVDVKIIKAYIKKK
jgi:cyclophilin family peptidyl-prolyl cis-trans isomerase